MTVAAYIYLKALENVKNVISMFSAFKYNLDFAVEVNFSSFYALFCSVYWTHVAFSGRRHDY